jgi:hypothetical protein
MTLRVRIAATAAVLLVLGMAAGEATVSAFKGSTGNPGDTFAAGSVILSDNDSGAATVSLAKARPGDSSSGCVKLTYTGSLPATVKLYGDVTGSLPPYLTITVTRGTQGTATFPSCTGFTPDTRNYYGYGPGILYSGPLSSAQTTYATGLDDLDNVTGGVETWTTGESHVLQYVVTMGSSTAARGLSGSMTIHAEARNQ